MNKVLSDLYNIYTVEKIMHFCMNNIQLYYISAALVIYIKELLL